MIAVAHYWSTKVMNATIIFLICLWLLMCWIDRGFEGSKEVY